MTQINDMFNEGFRSHADALARSGGLGEDFEQGAVKSIRRRRNVRAAGTGAGSLLAIGAVGVAAWAVPGVRDGIAAPAGTQGCEINPYLPVNPNSLAAPTYSYRAYIDLRPETENKKVVVVFPDGTIAEASANEEGAFVLDYAHGGFEVASLEPLYPGQHDSAFVEDHFGGATSGKWWDGESPVLTGYGWTTVVPQDVPDGINVGALASTFDTAINSGGTGYVPAAVPDGAVTDVIVTADGEDATTRLNDGDAAPSAEGASRVEMRVSGLPDGGTFSIVSTFDANDIPEPTCLPGAADPTSIPSPTAAPWEGVPPSMAPEQPGDATADADPAQAPTPGSGSSPDPGISSSAD